VPALFDALAAQCDCLNLSRLLSDVRA